MKFHQIPFMWVKQCQFKPVLNQPGGVTIPPINMEMTVGGANYIVLPTLEIHLHHHHHRSIKFQYPLGI